ncbi:hypothetical protein [Aeromicrobium sp. 9AM]|uniref:hypothetical protein n=1 Tax=Aeromicrobium sp. 9AM TaxID=2653126 RepID=UPI0012F029CC|nr:hypothetical protein [Aeromicrobium sp. 9AM]VXC09552.1 hypothetical protein AERO9AM_50040 [Aeromicrobium sp. 9AM]
MTEEPDEDQANSEPVRVVENVVSAWRWDAWRDAAMRIDRSAGWISIVLGIAAGGAAAAAGYGLIPGDGRLSAIVYAPLVGWGIRVWTRSWIATHRLKFVLAEVRTEVVPALVRGLDDARVLKLLTSGRALVTEQCTILAVERRDAAVALVASEYDLRHFPLMIVSGAGGG